MRSVTAIALLLIGGACTLLRRHWASGASHHSVDAARESIVYIDNSSSERRVHLRWHDGESFVKITDCLPGSADGILALSKSRGALVYSVASRGNLFHGGGLSVTKACLVDFEAGKVRALEPAILGSPYYLRESSVGAHTGRIYTPEHNGLTVSDLYTSQRVKIEWPGAGTTQTRVVESAGGGRIVSAELVMADPKSQRYRGRILVREFAGFALPPAIRAVRTIEVGGRCDRITVSVDGRYLAYDGRTYGANGEASDLGLVNLTSGNIEFELIGRPGRHSAEDIAMMGGIPYVLALSGPPDDYRVTLPIGIYWLNHKGQALGSALKNPPNYHERLIWLPGFSRVLAGEWAELDLLDLPPAPVM